MQGSAITRFVTRLEPEISNSLIKKGRGENDRVLYSARPILVTPMMSDISQNLDGELLVPYLSPQQ